jgi:hypothetical protein
VQTSVTLAGVHNGVGEKTDLLTPDEVNKALKVPKFLGSQPHVDHGCLLTGVSLLQQYLYVASILYILSLCAAKCSMFQLICRLTRTKSHTYASHIMTGITFLWGVAAVFAVAFQCKLPRPWNTTTQQNCPNLVRHTPPLSVQKTANFVFQFLSWATIEAFSLLIEVLICLLSLWLVWGLQMSAKLKVVVVGAFLLRILIVIPTTFKLVLLRRDLPKSEATFTATDVVIATQVTLHYTVMAATFPCMRAFLQAFNSGLGATTGLTTAAVYDSNAYAKGSKNGGSKVSAAYTLESVNRDVEITRTAGPASFRPDHGHTTTTTVTTAANPHQMERDRQLQGRQNRGTSQGSLDSDESKQPIIKKTLEWEVRHESRDLA